MYSVVVPVLDEGFSGRTGPTILGGMRAANMRKVIIMDADLDHPPKFIPNTVVIWKGVD